MSRKTLLSWSSGKDSAWTLQLLQQDPSIELVGLLTTISQQTQCVGSHGVHLDLVKRQAHSIGLPLHVIEIPYPSQNTTYKDALLEFVEKAKRQGVQAFAFGDLFLEDIRHYREQLFSSTGVEVLFPLWGKPTKGLAEEMISGGLKTLTTCVNAKYLGEAFVGCDFNQNFLQRLPEGLDPCGENGEFHSFVYDGPMFTQALAVRAEGIITQDNFIFTDLCLN